ncbi:cytochrome P450 [Artomyces pyxidatus]|uniref:Cytochrome P450 n=1 Tax=Artomyces pyxidatus TaxID=48021 RepID=A0ACB8T5V7_9AGAM|nr:cytochrome P450 [Artomyces pyxidatus]
MLLALSCIAFPAVIFLVGTRNKREYPPGPKPLPIIGNLFDVPHEASWLRYTEWANTYGDILSVRLLGQVIVIANSAKVAKDLLEKRAINYSDRPSIPFYEMMKWDWLIATTHYSDKWRTMRRIVDQGLRPKAALKYRGLQIEKTRAFLKRLLSHPEGYRDHISYLQGDIMMSLLYGYDVKDPNDHNLEIARAAVELAAQSSLPGAAIVNVFSLLKYFPGWLPGMGFKALAQKGHDLGKEMVRAPFEFVRDQMSQGIARPSFTFDSLQEYEDLGSDPDQAERVVAGVAGSLYISAADTTTAEISILFLMLATYPDVQRKAQAEIDVHIGRGKMPTFEDRPRLPYLEAICKELLRWKVIVPLGFARTAMADDVYEGYSIPKGAIVLANAWAILHDPVAYSEPESFRPERFINPDGSVRDDPALSSAFGIGKRICPGRHLVDSNVWFVAVSVLAVFDVRPAKDEYGCDIHVAPEFTGALVSHPTPFKCSITLRDGVSEKAMFD